MGKYLETVVANMQRLRDKNGNLIYDDKDNCYLLRNNTKILFGNQPKALYKKIGTVIMTNPGSYKFDDLKWDDFVKGKTENDFFSGKGKPDPTLRNIITAIRNGYDALKKPIPDGYVEVYNLSSVVCPEKDFAKEYHDHVCNHTENKRELINSVITVENDFLETCNSSEFVIIGFVKNLFVQEAHNVIKHAKNRPDKIVMAIDKKGWPSHPYMWRLKPELMNAAIENLKRVIS